MTQEQMWVTALVALGGWTVASLSAALWVLLTWIEEREDDDDLGGF